MSLEFRIEHLDVSSVIVDELAFMSLCSVKSILNDTETFDECDVLSCELFDLG